LTFLSSRRAILSAFGVGRFAKYCCYANAASSKCVSINPDKDDGDLGDGGSTLGIDPHTSGNVGEEGRKKFVSLSGRFGGRHRSGLSRFLSLNIVLSSNFSSLDAILYTNI
jgi:hypothetical protein